MNKLNKSEFIDFLEKSYLNGLTDSIKIQSLQESIYVEFINKSGGFAGKIFNNRLKGIFPEGEYGIFNIKKLIKSLSILGNNIETFVHLKQSVPQIEFKDFHIKFNFTLSDLMVITPVPNINEPEEYDIEFNIKKQDIENFIKSKNALDTDKFNISTDFDSKIIFSLGENVDYADKISFHIIPNKSINLPESIPFNADWFKEILSANKNFSQATIRLSKEGLMKIEFIEQFEHEGSPGENKTVYYLIRNQN